MPTIAELNAKVDELQTTLDAEQAAIAAKINQLNATIAELQTNINSNGTEADRQALFDKLTAISADIASTVE